MKLLEMKHIRKSFREGLTVLNDLSLTVEKGEVLVLIGSSGSGKSTVLRCAAQLETVDSGEIDICGRVLVRTGQKTDRRGTHAMSRSMHRRRNGSRCWRASVWFSRASTSSHT